MRIRSIKPEFWRSEDVASLPWETRLLFIGLWSYVDDNGVGRDDERIITAELFALDGDLSESSVRVRDGLKRLQMAGLITRYMVDGKSFLHITKWMKHQKINRPTPGRYPLPTSEDAPAHDVLTDDSVSHQREPLPGAVEQGISRSVDKEICSTAAPPNEPSPAADDSKPKRKLASKPGDPEGFDEFWEIYPRRVARGQAVKTFAKALKIAPLADILAGARRYADDPVRQRKEIEYTAHPSTWLGGQRWTDEVNLERGSPVGSAEAKAQSIRDLTDSLVLEYQESP